MADAAPPAYDAMFPEKQPLHGAGSGLGSAAGHGYAPPASQGQQHYPPPPQGIAEGGQANHYPVAMPVSQTQAVIAAPVGMVGDGAYPRQQYPAGQFYPGPPGTTSVVVTSGGRYNQRVRGNPNISESCWGSFEYVPALPLPLAILVFLINIGTAGFGTVLGGFFLLCFGNPFRENQAKGEVIGWCIALGLGQMVTFFFFFMGWFWAATWGVFFIICSARFYKRPFPAPGTTTTTTTVITTPVVPA